MRFSCFMVQLWISSRRRYQQKMKSTSKYHLVYNLYSFVMTSLSRQPLLSCRTLFSCISFLCSLRWHCTKVLCLFLALQQQYQERKHNLMRKSMLKYDLVSNLYSSVMNILNKTSFLEMTLHQSTMPFPCPPLPS